MQVRELMTREPLTVPVDTPVAEVRRMMAERGVRHLLVTDNARLAGFVTDHDVRLKVSAISPYVWEMNYLLARMTVEAIMTKAVITVAPARSAAAAANIMLEHKIGALPVVEAGTIVGLVTETDLLRAFAAMASAPPRELALPVGS